MTYSIWTEDEDLAFSITRHSDLAQFKARAVPRATGFRVMWDFHIDDQQTHECVYSTSMFCSYHSMRGYINLMMDMFLTQPIDVNNLIEFAYHFGGTVNGQPIVALKCQGTH